MNRSERTVYAYGQPNRPLIVASLERARSRAANEAAFSGRYQLVMRLDLAHPEDPPDVIGEAAPSGEVRMAPTYE